MERPERLFVYGTLLATARHPMGDLLRRAGELVGRGSIQARLYVIDDPDPIDNRYPGAVISPDPADRTHGEVWRIDRERETVFAALDRFEGCAPGCEEPFEFLLRTVDVAMEGGGRLAAGAYLYTWDVARARHVPSGRFVDVAPDVI